MNGEKQSLNSMQVMEKAWQFYQTVSRYSTQLLKAGAIKSEVEFLNEITDHHRNNPDLSVRQAMEVVFIQRLTAVTNTPYLIVD